jgi:hypothetical protein
VVDVTEVNRLLSASREAHKRKKAAAGIVDGQGKVIAKPNWPVAEQHIVEAFRTRVEAHTLDPEHTASGWNDDRASDKDLLAFFIAYSRPFLSEKHLTMAIERYPEFQDIAYIP